MPERPVIGILDIGRTNKKAFLFDENYNVVVENSVELEQTVDEDGFPCEDLERLNQWVQDSLTWFNSHNGLALVAANVSAYGASLVHIDSAGKTLTPLYNYLKPFPDVILDSLSSLDKQGKVWLETGSPRFGSLNSGLQLYRMKQSKPDLYTRIKYSLHLPQYIASRIHGQWKSELTSIGCHTALWDMGRKNYHQWVEKEGLNTKLAPIVASDFNLTIQLNNHPVQSGIGIHDSSAALLPYIHQFKRNFLLLSTGTWNICLNPNSPNPLSQEDLGHDCLCYLSIKGDPVKASRFFAGHELEVEMQRMADHFNVSFDYYKGISFNKLWLTQLLPGKIKTGDQGLARSSFENRDLRQFKSFENAYHQQIADLVNVQRAAIHRVMDASIEKIFVDGGFSENSVFMNLLSHAFPGQQVYSATVHQASALGAAMVIHKHWNQRELLDDKIETVHYPFMT